MKRAPFVFLTTALVLLAVAAVAQDEKPKRHIGTATLDQILEHDQRYADGAFIYIPDEEALEVFRAVDVPVTIKLFYRTDCSDSVREVPKFIKTVQLADNANITVEAVGMNAAKDEPADLIAGWDIKRVPTFIVVHDGKEIGRVVETVVTSIETDLAEILEKLQTN